MSKDVLLLIWKSGNCIALVYFSVGEMLYNLSLPNMKCILHTYTGHLSLII